jgi:murein DD-endopeptidase MepM/ murein hydrolase activator NlpD
MDNEFREDSSTPTQGEGEAVEPVPDQKPEPRINQFSKWLETLTSIGLGETLIRVGTTVFFIILLIGAVWLLRSFYKNTSLTDNTQNVLAAEPTPTQEIGVNEPPVLPLDPANGIRRQANIHTIIPDRPRTNLTTYIVQEGDTVIGIGEKFGLKPQTILWGNYNKLRDDPHNLKPGQELNILPVNGTFYQWQPGDGLNGVAKFFGVKPEDIINFPANAIDAATIGDYTNPNIKVGTWLIVPGGERQFISWSAPVGITRSNPAAARVLGEGSCGKISGGAVGFGSFIWPANRHYLSGFDYSVETNHRGIDIAGKLGEPVYAADSGVIVYSGWNNWGYGNMIIIDHGSDWQTLYGHLSAINVGCGQSVGQGEVIGAIGSTGNSSGPHLHFEMMHSIYSKVNPWDFLPPP